MSARDDLDVYLRELHRRVRLGALARGASLVLAAALLSTVAVVLLARLLLFTSASVSAGRIVLLLALVLSVLVGIALPLWRLTHRRAAAMAEQRYPQFEQRLLTYVERDRADPFIELLAADTLEVGRDAPPAGISPRELLSAWLAAGAVSAAVLIWLIAAAPGFMGYGAHLVWTGKPRGPIPHYEIAVAPGNATIRRHSDQAVTARLSGVHESDYLLYARYQSSTRWERVRMQASDSGYQFVLTAVPEDVEYYVQAGTHRSPHFVLRTVDPPQVKQLRVTYHFPDWTRLPDQTEEPGGDLRALEGTQATLSITTDRPLSNGLLVLDDGGRMALAGGPGNRYQGVIHLQQDGAYHIAYLDRGQPVRLSEDYFIEARKAAAPSVAIVRPGGDYRASPIEEVTVGVRASDEFGLQQLQLHYSVNGGPERTLDLLGQKGSKQADAARLLALEDYKLVPGDVISVYATANNALLNAHTEISFIQVEPFEREFSQSQSAGGGGGGGGQNGEVSQREKEIIAATFKSFNDHAATTKQAEESAKFLSEVQSALRDQSLSLAGRLSARDLTAQNNVFNRFQQEMTAAAAAMSPAAQQLQQQHWQGAIAQEQQALQHLLRAEATFREIEVAYGSRGGGGAGAGRDLASLFDLELDTEKNQYETQQTASSADQRARDINDALKKLDELARRQQELAQRQGDDRQQAAEQRWQQELLQRQAEELQRQIEQLAQATQSRGQGASAGDASSSSQSSGSSDSNPSQQGSAQPSQSDAERQRAMQRVAQQALEQLRQAQHDMQRAAAEGRSADARLAAERLREAVNALMGMQSQQSNQRVASIADEAQRLVQAEADQSARVKRVIEHRLGPAQSVHEIQQLMTERQRLADSLVNLQQNMRDAARELDLGQRAAADKLRAALKNLDDANLEALLQRTSDWLRTGIDPNSRNTESEVASALRQLSEQTRQAQQALTGGALPGGPQTEQALNALARLRDRIAALTAQNGSPSGAQNDTQSGAQNGAQDGSQSGSPNGMAGGAQSGGQGGAQNGGRGDIARGGGGPNGGVVLNNLDTGDNARTGSQAHAPAAVGSLADTQQLIEQGVGELSALRRAARDDPPTERQIQQLISDMEHLDLRRFPGNPAMIEHIHQQLLTEVDSLQLQLRRKLDAQQEGEIRAAEPLAIPRGYEAAVADYFRRLSSAGVSVRSTQ